MLRDTQLLKSFPSTVPSHTKLRAGGRQSDYVKFSLMLISCDRGNGLT